MPWLVLIFLLILLPVTVIIHNKGNAFWQWVVELILLGFLVVVFGAGWWMMLMEVWG